jgi:hypothetical protein
VKLGAFDQGGEPLAGIDGPVTITIDSEAGS